MTTLYRPVLIESAEQAEALPEGTIANRVLKFESTWETLEQPEVAVKIGRNAWYSTAVDDDAWDWLDRHLVGWSALVPIEAEEQTRPGNWFSPGGFCPEKLVYHPGATRLVTPWEAP